MKLGTYILYRPSEGDIQRLYDVGTLIFDDAGICGLKSQVTGMVQPTFSDDLFFELPTDGWCLPDKIRPKV